MLLSNYAKIKSLNANLDIEKYAVNASEMVVFPALA